MLTCACTNPTNSIATVAIFVLVHHPRRPSKGQCFLSAVKKNIYIQFADHELDVNSNITYMEYLRAVDSLRTLCHVQVLDYLQDIWIKTFDWLLGGTPQAHQRHLL